MKQRYFQGDLVIWTVFFFLCAISLIEVFSAGTFLYAKSGYSMRPFLMHSFLLFGAAAIAFVVHRLPYGIYRIIPLLFYLPSLILLSWALVGGENLNNGARWVSIMGLSLQPSEIAKGILVMTVALVLARHQGPVEVRRKAFTYIMLFTIPVCALIITQNFSTAALLFAVVCIMMFVGRVPKKYLLGLFGGFVLAGALVWGIFKALPEDPYHPIYDNIALQRVPTWRARFKESMVITPDPKDFVVTDRNRQIVHARIAMARGKVIGLTPGRSVQRDYLSAAYSDFIYAIIAEEMGLLGSTFVLILYLVLLYRVGRIARRCRYNFPAFLAIGFGVMLVLQALVNMLVAVGIGPVTGQPLPLVSKGGTSTLITGFYFGVILAVSRSVRVKELREQQEQQQEPQPEQQPLLPA